MVHEPTECDQHGLTVGTVGEGTGESVEPPIGNKSRRNFISFDRPWTKTSQALRRRGVRNSVLEEAERFERPVCQERQKSKPRPLASLEPRAPKWSL